MRGSDKTSGSLFSYVGLEDRVPAGHPLRVIREIVNDALADLNAELARRCEGWEGAPRCNRHRRILKGYRSNQVQGTGSVDYPGSVRNSAQSVRRD